MLKRKLVSYFLILSMIMYSVPAFADENDTQLNNSNSINITEENEQDLIEDASEQMTDKETATEENTNENKEEQSTTENETEPVTESETITENESELATESDKDEKSDIFSMEEQEPSPEEPNSPINHALNLPRKSIAASSEVETDATPPRTLEAAFDGDLTTRWASNNTINVANPETAEWLAIDLGNEKEFNE